MVVDEVLCALCAGAERWTRNGEGGPGQWLTPLGSIRGAPARQDEQRSASANHPAAAAANRLDLDTRGTSEIGSAAVLHLARIPRSPTATVWSLRLMDG